MNPSPLLDQPRLAKAYNWGLLQLSKKNPFTRYIALSTFSDLNCIPHFLNSISLSLSTVFLFIYKLYVSLFINCISLCLSTVFLSPDLHCSPPSAPSLQLLPITPLLNLVVTALHQGSPGHQSPLAPVDCPHKHQLWCCTSSSSSSEHQGGFVGLVPARPLIPLLLLLLHCTTALWCCCHLELHSPNRHNAEAHHYPQIVHSLLIINHPSLTDDV